MVLLNHFSENLVFSRDSFGLDPFYYFFQEGVFLFGRSISEVVAQLKIHPIFNRERLLQEFFSKDSRRAPFYSNETFYQGIYRLEPGHSLRIEAGKLLIKPLWKLDPEASDIVYRDERDYVVHFNELLKEAVICCIQGAQNVGAEFSGGLDSSAVITQACFLGIKPPLFSHVREDGTGFDSPEHARAIMKKFGLSTRYVTSKGFNVLSVLDELSEVYAGPVPYPFFALANNVHRAVQDSKVDVLLSGFGGDECVSSGAQKMAFYPQLLRNQGFSAAYAEMFQQTQRDLGASPNAFLNMLRVLRYTSPLIFNSIRSLKELKGWLEEKCTQKEAYRCELFSYYPTLRHFEYARLQGELSQHLRMRIEYSAVLAKHYGFRYAYPLLYPPLVEFCFRLPLHQKRNLGLGRHLIRDYLSQYYPRDLVENNFKKGQIMPATMEYYQQQLRAGVFEEAFKNLPFQKQIQKMRGGKYFQDLAKIPAYMLKRYCEKHGIEIPDC